MASSLEALGSGTTSLTIQFSNTKPNEKIAPSGIFLDFRGNLTGSIPSGKSRTLIIQGGDDKGAYAQNQDEPIPFFMTDSQRRSLMRIIRAMASTSDKGTITSPNGTLDEMCNAMYRNYIG